MTPISPSLTASSSTTAAQSLSSVPQTSKDINMLDFEMDSGLDFFNFDSFESDHEADASTAHSPTTISPNHTPSPLPVSQSPVTIVNPLDSMDNFDFDFGFDKMQSTSMPMAGPSEPIPFIKQEPIEFGWNVDSQSSSPVAPLTMPTASLAVPAQPDATPSAAPDMTLGPITPEQQLALQQLMLNILNYQKGLGMHADPAPAPAPATIQPSLVFSTSPAQTSTAVSSAALSPVAAIQVPAASVQAGPSKPRAASSSSARSAMDMPRDFDREASPPLREIRQGSTFSFPDLDSKIDGLVPLNDIFSAGRGKGGKKGGGVSSVVRMEDEDLDEDDSWRPSAEEYKKLSSKEKRQLRNKLSARAFRTRRKDYIGTLEDHIKHRDTVIDAMRSELASSKNETMDLRRELETLKANTMKVLHPETAEVESQAPALVTALSMSSAPTTAPTPVAGPSQVPRRSATPVFNPRKDLSSSIGSPAFWGGSDKNMFGGGSTICHHLLTPDLVLPESAEASSSSVPTLKSFADLPRVNLNPALNDTDMRGNNLQATGNARNMSSSFDAWSESNAFSLRSMDAYRMQLWGRLAREAAADKANVPPQLRPKFFVEPKTRPSTATHDLSPKGITDRLASSFWSAFEGPGAKLDAQKLAAVVTGVAKLKVVASSSSASASPREEYNEKSVPLSAARQATEAVNSNANAADALSMAMGSLKLVSGNGGRVETFSVRENPLGALSSFFLHAATPARA